MASSQNRRWHCEILLLLPAAIALLAPAGAVAQTGGRAAPPVFTGADAGPLTLLLPKLAAAPAPSWVKPGLRLTYYGASASVAGSGKEWQIDPDGDFQTPDGRRWSGAD